MDAFVSTDTLFDLAVRLELKGDEFYSMAVAHTNDEEMKNSFRELAEAEREHAEKIRHVKAVYREATGAPGARDEKVTGCLKAFMEEHVFHPDEDIAKILAELRDEDELLKKAIVAEKDMIALFTGLKAFVGDGHARETIENIIIDEMGHIARLNELFEIRAEKI